MIEGLTQNWVAKLLSLIFAVILWFFVMGEQKLEVGYAVPLEVRNIPAGMMVANDVPSLIDVRISGPRTLLMNLRPSDISLSVDLRGLQPGLTTLKRLEERLNIPSALKVTRISPAYVDIKLERINEKEVPVKVEVTGSAAPGFKVASIRVKPDRVTVEGAESELKNVEEVRTEPVDLEGVKQDFTLIAPLNYLGKYTSLKNQKTVEVGVGIAPEAGALQDGAAEEPKEKTSGGKTE